ncbi:uncharacterized protein LTR77_003498 [Saxophila tyrrhenica]|uniref:Methyltransferase domain-containing protein n=1 Tax=Saxophila tyrrhenica TaxID=1690608 RepID=A0AAV9PF60_9PEZI|nr:hypothetical protein LTR77_003498 [Saxophila tyrrhenica]
MASEGKAPDWDKERDEFWIAQDFETSARLHVQHWIWQFQLAYALHPRIDTSGGKPLRVADIGAGNAAWLLELTRLFPSQESVQLDGFDITSSNFPHAAWLPSNLKLHTWNAFSDLPSEYVEAFDIVHIRALNSTIVNNKVDPMLVNALKMLKPGGYLQWDENDALKLACNVPDESVNADAATTITKMMEVIMKYQTHLHADWLHNMPETLRERGCEIVAHEVTEAKKELARATTDNYLLVWKDLIRMIPEAPMPLPPGMGLPESMSRRSFSDLVRKAVEETAKGASLTMPFHVTVARKTS